MKINANYVLNPHYKIFAVVEDHYCEEKFNMPLVQCLSEASFERYITFFVAVKQKSYLRRAFFWYFSFPVKKSTVLN